MRYWPGCTTNAGWMLAYRESVRRYFGSSAVDQSVCRYPACQSSGGCQGVCSKPTLAPVSATTNEQ